MRRIIPFVIIFLVVSVFFAPLWSGQKIVLNGNFLVSFYAPWKFDKFTGFPAGVPAKQGGGYDQLRIGYPYFTQVWEAWRNLRVPLWNPYNFAGLPLAAETQSAAFYPLHFLAFFLPNMVIWNIFVVSGFFLAFLFMYLFLKDVTANTTASLFAGFTYAFCHFFIVWTQEVVTAQHAALWLPLALLAIRRLDSSKLWWFILTGAFILSILSGYIQVSIYVISTCLLYSLWQVKQPHVDSYKHFLVLLLVLASLGVALGLSAFQLLPLREMNAYSSRNIVDMRPFLKENLIPWYALLQLVVPDFFGNSGTWNHYGYPQGTFYEHMFAVSLPALMIAIYGFLSLRSPKDKFFFAFIAISPFIIIIDSPLSRSLFDLPIPVLSTSIANRILFLPAFGIASLAAMGIKNWQSDSFGKDKNLLLKIGLSLAIFTSFLLLFTLRSSYTLFRPFGFPVNWAMIGFRNSLLPSLILFVVILTILMVRKRIVTPGKVIVVCFFLAFLQTGLFMNKVVTFSDSRLLYPSHQLFDFLKSTGKYDRFWGFGDGYVENNLATIAQVYSPEGYDSLADRRYAQLLYTVGNQGRWTENISRSDATINRQTVDKSFIDDKRRQRLLSLLSVRYILHRYLPDTKRHDLRNDFVDPDLYSPLATMSGITIYENKQAFPRAYLAGRVLQRTENQAIIDTLFDRDIDPRHTAVLEESYSPYLEADPQGSVKIIDYQPEYVRLQSISSAPQMLVLTDVFYPGWRAFVDDQETKIYRTQFALRSIYLPNGSHSIEFRYNPQSFNLGLQISLSTLLLVIVVTMVVTLWIKKTQKG